MSVPPNAGFRSAFVTLVLVLSVASAAAQVLVQGSKPAKTQIPEYSEAFCSSLPGEFAVCKVLASGRDDAEYTIRKAGTTVNRIPDSTLKIFADVTRDAFFTYQGDLDHDGTSEIVLVALERVSNGMGVTYSTVYIFDGRSVEVEGPPISFPVQEFGQRDNFIFNPSTRRTEILISYWGEYATIEPKRIPGVYLIGKWFRYRNGKLEPILEKPTLARRYLNSFADERINDWFEDRRPYMWLKDRRTHKFFREPAEAAQLLRTENGTIARFVGRPSAEDSAPEFDFRLSSGQVVKGKLRGDWNPDEGKATEIRAFGLWTERYLYPLSWAMEFNPATFLDRIEGRRVRLEIFKTGSGDEFIKVWLLDR